MAFDWSQYLALARELEQHTQEEAALRSAISRAYYAAFCTARNRLKRQGVPVPQTGEAHGAVWDHYRQSADRTVQRMGTDGDRLRWDRNRADYNDSFAGLQSATTHATNRAGRLLADLANLA